MSTDADIARLTQRIYRLEQEVAELRARQGTRGRRPVAPPPAPEYVAVPAAQPVAQAPARPFTTPRPAVVKTPMDEADEASVVGAWFARVGMLAILIGIGFAFKYAADKVGPTPRVVLGLIAGSVFVGWGELVFRRGWERFAQAVTGGGIAIWYLSILAALHLYDLIPPATAFVALVGATSIGVALAFRQQGAPLAVIALVGGFVNPFIVGAEHLEPTAFLAYILALDLFIIGVAGRRWAVLDRVALVGSWLVAGAVTPQETIAQRMGFATILFSIFALLPFIRGREKPSEDGSLRLHDSPDVVLGAGAAYTLYMLSVMVPDYEGWRGLFVLALAATFAIGAWFARELRLRFDAIWMTGSAIVLATVFVPIQFEGAHVGAGWAIEGVAWLAFVTYVVTDERVRALAHGLLGAGTVFVVGGLADTYPPDRLVLTWGTLSVAIVFACIIGAAFIRPRDGGDGPLSVPSYVLFLAANVVGLVWMSQELTAEISRQLTEPIQAIHFGLTALWAVYGASMLFAGVALRTRWARLAGVTLLSITVVKLAVDDIWLLRTSYRIFAFIGLGVVLLVCSVMYQRFRDVLLADDTPSPKPPEPVVAETKAQRARKTASTARPAAKKAPARKAASAKRR